MKVFHVISHFDLGGAERVAVNICHSATPGMEYHIVEVIRGNTPYTGKMIQELKEAGIVYHRAYMPEIKFHYLFERLAALTFPLWFIFIFRKYRPDVIHCHTEIPEFATYCFFRLFPKLLKTCKVVRTIHNTTLWNGMEWIAPRVERFMQSQQANIAISSSVRENYRNTYGQEPPIIYNGVSDTGHQRCYQRLRAGKTNILFAGRFEQQKGITHLVEIIQQMQNDNRYFFHIIGDGRLKTFLVSSLQNCHNAEICPTLFGLSDYLSSFDYLLMPSEHEGLSMLSIEASMSCLPVIANNCKGLKDTLPADWPLKVEDNRLEAYLHLFSNILPTLHRNLLGQQARQFALQHFTIQGMQSQYEKVYRLR